MLEGLDTLGTHCAHLKIILDFSASPTQLYRADDTIFHRHRAQQPELGRPRICFTGDASWRDRTWL